LGPGQLGQATLQCSFFYYFHLLDVGSHVVGGVVDLFVVFVGVVVQAVAVVAVVVVGSDQDVVAVVR